jgi:4-hydroxybenzoate polyprenyltransferase
MSFSISLFERIYSYLLLVRPFTLVAPFSGIICGASIASNGMPKPLIKVLFACISAALLNGSSNIINQVCDLEIDRINKPERPLPKGKLGRRECILICLIIWVTGAAISTAVGVLFTTLYVLASILMLSYSIPPFRTKRYGFLANLTIAVPRGVCLVVAGKAAVHGELSSLWNAEIWFAGGIFTLFLLGAATAKDFSDMRGDRKYGCSTLPCRFGVSKTIRIISPFFILPFLLLPIGEHYNILEGNPDVLLLVGIALAAVGMYTVIRMELIKEKLLDKDDRTSWIMMYVLLIGGHLAVAAAYVV